MYSYTLWKNVGYRYRMGSFPTEVVDSEKDLGVVFS